MSGLFALVLIFSADATTWTEEITKANISFEICDKAQKAIWAEDWRIVATDMHGMGIPEVDAYCIAMEDAPSVGLATYSVD